MKKMVLAFAGLLIVISLVMIGLMLTEDKATATVTTINAENTLPMIPVTGAPTSVPTESSTVTPVVLLPIPVEQIVNGFVLNEIVDLSNEQPVALTIRLADGSLLASNWAGARAYQGNDDPETAFSPSRGVIYSYLGDVTTTWAHSGINRYGQRFFATNLELYLRKDADGRVVSLAEAEARARDLIGDTAYLCQSDVGLVKVLSDFDPTADCSGGLVEMEVVAVAIVPHEMLPEYDGAILDINQWLIDNFPEAGFDQLNQNNGWLVRFCIGQLDDQTSDGTPSYLYNRGVIGFRVLDGSG